MNDIQYIGEHLLPGQLGHFFIIFSFCTSILAALAYFFATQHRDKPDYEIWHRMGRIGFSLHGLSVFAIIGTIFYIMLQQYYEYNYVWAHVSEDLPFEYIFSAFWEGQEGSFLLWMFWHVVLGFVLMFTAKNWESPVLSTLSVIQIFIGSMILGVYFGSGEGEFKVGSNPFVLLRDVMDAPIFAKADYVSMVSGNGLNPLLQNYWMTIHPPTLFLGFAATAIPFCFAIAGWWTKEPKAWLKPVLPWALFCGAILGTGILMGGAWAYEALSFGGYWAWDPVENMSLVPWLILIAGIHTNLVAKNTNHSIKTTYIFYTLSFVLIVYSTFLTRSGVLGDTSVHAFTEMGLEAQLISFIAFFALLSVILYFRRLKFVPVPANEEATGSKEFWMFIGSLVLLFSSALITASTSLPVYNKIYQIFDPAYEGGVIKDPVLHYNKYQLWIGVFIGFLSGFAQYLRYREVNWTTHAKRFAQHLLAALVIATILTFASTLWINANAWQYKVLLFSGIFAVITNLDYLLTIAKGNMKMAGSVIAHTGFGLMIVGILASGLNKAYISNNEFAQRGLIEGFTDENYKRNVLLMKGEPMLMSGYEVTYVKDSIWSFNRQFEVNYKKKNEAGEIVEEFSVYPNVLYDKSLTKIAASNPSTKRYLSKDIFSHVASLPKAEMDPEYAKAVEDSLQYERYEALVGDTIRGKTFYAVVQSVSKSPSHPEYQAEPNDMAFGVKLLIGNDKLPQTFEVEPVLVLRQTLLYNFPSEVDDLMLKVKLSQELFERVFTPESEMNYQSFVLKKGEQVLFNGNEVTFQGFNLQPDHPRYRAQEGDIAVAARLQIRPKDKAEVYLAEPLYLIRQSLPSTLDDEITSLNLRFRFNKIDPKTESIELLIADAQPSNPQLPIEIVEEVPRTDYIVLEAILFPGINFFWLGSTMMMLGLFLSMHYRRSQRKGVH
ncbi:MAG: cytochrome c biogenesis protein CcsA [Bacteroidota bacterium]